MRISWNFGSYVYKSKRRLIIMGFGDIFSTSWKEYKDNFWLYFKLILFFVFIPSIILSIITQVYGWSVGYDVTNYTFIFVSAILAIIVLFIGVFASVSIYASALFGKKKYSDAFAKGKNFYWKYIGFMIVLWVFLILLFFAFIIPGIIFMIFWVFAVYILIGEDKGILESLGQSFRIVKGRWWKVFGYFLLFGLIIFGIYILFSIPTWPTGMMIFTDAFKNPELYVEGAVPTTLMLVHENLETLFSGLSRFIIIPLGILFFKNFYFEMKKSGKKKK